MLWRASWKVYYAISTCVLIEHYDFAEAVAVAEECSDWWENDAFNKQLKAGTEIPLGTWATG